MRFVYPAELEYDGESEFVVSFRDVQGCHTSGEDVAEALFEAADALETIISAHIADGNPIPMPSAPLPGEYPVALPLNTAAKAALTLAMRKAGLAPGALAERLGADEKSVRRMLDPRRDIDATRFDEALRVLGSELVIEVRELATAEQSRVG